MIPYGRQDISQSDIDAVVEVLTSDFLTQGPQVPAFEAALCDATGAPYAIAVNSATSALHIACMALDLGAGDWLWTVPNTFVASANVGIFCGAQVDFVDTDPRTYVMCADALAAKLEQAKVEGRLPKIVMPVHFAGQSADMATISQLAKRYGFKVIEDASHAIGATYKGQPVGNCAHSDICVFSFHPVKIVTTAEGGCATTRSATLASRLVLHRSHGVTRDTALMQSETSPGGWYYEQIELGYNYRMTEMQAALGRSQMTRLNEFVAQRHAHAARYDQLLADLPLTTPFQDPDSHSALHLYPVQVENRAAVFAALRAAGIGVNVHYIPVHTQPFWTERGFARGDFPNAERYYDHAISLPLYPGLSESDQDFVATHLRTSLGA